MMEELPEKTNNTFKNKKIEDMENIGYTMLQKPLEALNIVYPLTSSSIFNRIKLYITICS